MELGMHIADFSWTGGPASFGADLAQHVRNAEDAGIARITVMDHFWQIRGVGPVDHEMYEAYSVLAFIAAHTQRALLHALVTGVTYRQPALVAKAVTTLDVLSGGRAGLGIGAAWNEDESAGLGFPFPPAKERLDRLEEAVQICRQMWSDSEEPYQGAHYQLGRTLDAPGPLHRPYLMIGGGGEKRTLRLVAQYADACNLFPSEDMPHKLDALRAHCDAVGRDYDSIEKTATFHLDPGQSADDIVQRCEGLRELGFTAAYVNAVSAPEPRLITDTLGEAAARLG